MTLKVATHCITSVLCLGVYLCVHGEPVCHIYVICVGCICVFMENLYVTSMLCVGVYLCVHGEPGVPQVC